MSRYFARLAQRSDVAPRAPQSVDTATTPTFGQSLEQYSEVVAASSHAPTTSIAALAPSTKSAAPIATIPLASTPATEAQTSIAPPPTTEPALPHTSRHAAQSVRDTDNLHTHRQTATPIQTPTPVAAPTTASADAHVDTTIDRAPTERHRAIATTTYVHDVGAVETSRPDSPVAAPMTNAADRVALSVDVVTSNELISNDNTQSDVVRARPVARAFTSTQPPASRASEAAPSYTTPQPSTRAPEVHVHIGKIELDVHAPTPPQKQSTPAPAAVPIAPAPARAPRFNAHRYYLRGG